MSLLSQVRTGRTQRPPRLLVYGVEKIGKSTFAAGAPAPIFVQVEDGLDEIECASFPRATSYSLVKTALLELRDEEHSFETVVIDSLDWLERLIWADVCRIDGADSIHKVQGGYAKGYDEALKWWVELKELLDSLRTDRGMAVIAIAHAEIKRFEDPDSPAFDRYQPKLNKLAVGLMTEWADGIFFATRKMRTQTEDKGFGKKRSTALAIGKDGGDRVLRLSGGPSCIAGNRYGLSGEIPLDWGSLMAAMTTQTPADPVGANGTN